ncbi:MAG: DNA methyltransferase [Fimbriiglobus sp.]
MILAGTSAKGCCRDCGTPWKRVTEETKMTRDRPNDYVKRTGEEGTGNSCPNSAAGVEVRTVGWEPGCECGWESGCECGSGEDTVVPCTVLDPFIGSGTTCVVALSHGRRAVGIDLSEKYLTDNAVVRVSGELLSRPATADLVPGKKRFVFAGGTSGKPK